ncbi:23S ribosomal RNA methyltransferase Erm [Granulicoccus sp. GXG6511]|uniref:23S ribosomal RNA methyltransferase Erm n=1 Tax=Granulicoccus sp. GXG6511 TaxID=3381351 RepID=UPI003D7CBD52
MPTYAHGRHELGQNYLTDRTIIDTILGLVRTTNGPIIEIGPGAGALTSGLVKINRPLTLVEIDSGLVGRLRDHLPREVVVEHADFLRYRLPNRPHVLVGNLPFHQTTAILRRILHAPHWTDAVLLVQWEVARRRAGVGGSSMMTAQWSPWVTFELHDRVPARAFTPRPGVDGGILAIRRNQAPRLPVNQRRKFQGLVHRVYTGPGRGLAQILPRTTNIGSPAQARRWLGRFGLQPHDLPRSLSSDAWIDLFRTTGTSPPRK